MLRRTACRIVLSAQMLAMLLALLSGGTAQAGPWPRQEGGGFLSLSVEQDRNDNRYSGLYAEYGLTARNTLGFELGQTEGEASAMLWLQRALDRGEGANRWVMSLGLGAIRRDGAYHPVGQVGSSWGRGFDSIPVLNRVPGGGWLAVDARFKIAGIQQDIDFGPDVIAEDVTYLTPEMTSKAELTLGWHATSSMMLINQFRMEDRDDTGFSGKLATSVVHDLFGPSKLELGIVAPLSGPGENAIKIGTWLEF